MNWKRFKSLPESEKSDESRFILGIDLGNATSAIAYFDAARGAPELMDISGGYGRPSVPTVMQYIPETREWVFGEYAVLNKGLGRDVTLRYLIDKLGRREYTEVESKPVSNVSVLSIYLKELVGNVKNINPKAEIAGIIASVPGYLGEDAKEELLWAFKSAGYEREMIELLSDRECVFNRYYLANSPKAEKILLLDYGSRELRGGLYEAGRSSTVDGNGTAEFNGTGNGTTDGSPGGAGLKCLSSLFDEELGTKKLEDVLYGLLTEEYASRFSMPPERVPGSVKDQIYSFMYQHKDMLFQKNLAVKPVKLYFNFAYPPFQKTVTQSEMDIIIRPYREGFASFINNVLGRNIYGGNNKTDAEDIDTVLCVGGGFEMLWARETVMSIFPSANVIFHKNAKGVTAEGAAVAAAYRLGVVKNPALEFSIEDLNQIRFDICVQVTKEKKKRFVPVIEKNSFWWQNHAPRLLILNEQCGGACIELYKRNESGDSTLIKELPLDGLPERPPGTQRIRLSAQMKKFDELTIHIEDDGFGEFFPKTDYELEDCIEVR